MELKPCPFCGGEAAIARFNDIVKFYRIVHFCNDFFWIKTDWVSTEEKAAELWNTRKEE